MPKTSTLTYLKAIGLLTALLLPGLAHADSSCGWRHAEYRLDWTANMAFETNLAGAPTLAYAKSKLGPDLPVSIHYGGATERFAFDSPKVAPEARTFGGVMELRQTLASHHETTRLELWFDRNVHKLRVDVHDFDEDQAYPRTFADRLNAVGVSHPDHRATLARVEAPGRDARQNASRDHLRAATTGSVPLRPIPGPTFSENLFSPLTLHFDAPVQKLMLSFGSEEDASAPRARSQTPSPQRIIFGDVTFCAALDNS